MCSVWLCCGQNRPMPQQAKDRLGHRGEALARRFLRWRKGLRIIESNWRQAHLGELDIVALDGTTLVFVEVKTRRDEALAIPEDAITADKPRRLRQRAHACI